MKVVMKARCKAESDMLRADISIENALISHNLYKKG